ncbi:MAG: putative GTPase related to EngC [Labilithrix sp.]|nr:putative GTPase related to EngC [Labilithrix sp.]
MGQPGRFDSSVLRVTDADATLRFAMTPSDDETSPSETSASLSLDDLGWSAELAAHVTEAEAALRPARIASVYSAFVDVWLADTTGPRMASLRGRALRDAPEGGVAVGDWALVASASEGTDDVVVERILPRRTAFVRQAAGERSEPQAIAANVDRVLVVTSVEGDFNARRLERYLVAIAGSGAEAVIVLAKADLLAEADDVVRDAEKLAPVILTSARTGLGVEQLRAQIPRGTTAAMVGSSGVGKSALVNALLGRSAQHEGAVREHDKRGRHTTTKRSLFAVPGGGLLVDTPGMRELKPWQAGAADDDVEGAFADIADLAASCRFGDCRHAAEPGCAIRTAVADGRLDAERVASWEKLERERGERKARQDVFAQVQEKRRNARAGAVALRKRLLTKRGR